MCFLHIDQHIQIKLIPKYNLLWTTVSRPIADTKIQQYSSPRAGPPYQQIQPTMHCVALHVLIFIEKKSEYKWIRTVQTSVVQGLKVYIFLLRL